MIFIKIQNVSKKVQDVEKPAKRKCAVYAGKRKKVFSSTKGCFRVPTSRFAGRFHLSKSSPQLKYIDHTEAVSVIVPRTEGGYCKCRIFRTNSIFVSLTLQPFVRMKFSYSR